MYVKFWYMLSTLSGPLGLLNVWWHKLTKHPDYLMFLHAFIASYNFLAKCIWGTKGMGVVLVHVWKKPLEYWGMIPSLSGLLATTV